MARNHSDAAVVLFEPRQTFRVTRGGKAMLNFSLKTAPKDPVHLEILDSDGKLIRNLETKARIGMNRVQRDLRHDSPRLVTLRTVAPDNPHIWQEPRFRDSDSRPITHWGSKPARTCHLCMSRLTAVNSTPCYDGFFTLIAMTDQPTLFKAGVDVAGVVIPARGRENRCAFTS
jgi:hypothetical protein